MKDPVQVIIDSFHDALGFCGLVIILMFVAGALAHCQSYPDAPSAQQTVPEWGVPPPDPAYYPPPHTWGRALTAKPFLVSEFAMAGSMAWDIRETERALHDCPWLVEQNDWWVGPRPSTWALARRDLFTFGLVSTFNAFMSRYASPWVSVGPAAAFSGRHLQGVYHWHGAC